MVGVVEVRIVGVGMDQGRVAMPMGVGFAGRVIGRVLMLVVFVMHVEMGMGHFLMAVFMFMVLGQVQPDTGSHEQGRGHQLEGQDLLAGHQGQDRADERRQGKISRNTNSQQWALGKRL